MDVQNQVDDRCITIDKVGLRGVRVPVSVPVDSDLVISTVGDLDLSVELPHMFRGTHMSRLFEEFNKFSSYFWVDEMAILLRALQSRLETESAFMRLEFPVFIEKKAPVTKVRGPMSYSCALGGRATGDDIDVTLEVSVPVTTLCPCSRELADFGAHNQRGVIKAVVRFKKAPVLIELIKMIEDCGSCGIYSVLKRPDEKYVTEMAYKNPRFVEDVVREVAQKFAADENITWFAVEVESQESIHDHNAYAFIKRDKRK
jgi:GTP cyclohydrolase I